MSKFIVCLGYNLQLDDSISPILENRLKDTVRLCKKNTNSILLLMGSSSYHGSGKHIISEASAMKEYLENNFKQELKSIQILTEETTTSTVEQLCYLKKFIKKEQFFYSDVIIVSSEFFSNRMKIYAKYILGTVVGINFIDSAIPKDLKIRFKEIEENKFKQAQEWLKNHKKGDDQKILEEQKVFQEEVKIGKIIRPVS